MCIRDRGAELHFIELEHCLVDPDVLVHSPRRVDVRLGHATESAGHKHTLRARPTMPCSQDTHATSGPDSALHGVREAHRGASCLVSETPKCSPQPRLSSQTAAVPPLLSAAESPPQWNQRPFQAPAYTNSCLLPILSGRHPQTARLSPERVQDKRPAALHSCRSFCPSRKNPLESSLQLYSGPGSHSLAHRTRSRTSTLCGTARGILVPHRGTSVPDMA
eukprot:3052573-Rhodomonas_salina.5